MQNIAIDSNLLLILSCIIFVIVIFTIVLVIVKNKKEDIEDEIEDVQEDLEEIKKIEIENTCDIKSDIEVVLEHMQENLETKPAEVVETFERDQEDKAIISYKELVRVLKEGETSTNLPKMNHVDFNDLDEEPNNLKDLVNKVKIPMSKDSFKKFKSSEFISPVFGKDKKLEQEVEIEEVIEPENEVLDKYNLNDYIEEFNVEKSNFNSL